MAVLGTNISRSLRTTPDRASEEGLRQSVETLAHLPPLELDLLVLPESTISIPLDGAQASDYLHQLGEMVVRVGAPILVGALGSGVGGGQTGADPAVDGVQGVVKPTNSAFLVDRGGALVNRYDKQRLVPGMERGGFNAGKGVTVFPVGGHRFGPLICYESLFFSVARAQARAGAKVLVNISSDIWFGSGTTGFSSLFLHQHAAHLVMRSVETRSAVARAGNGGFSLLLDPNLLW